MYPEQTNTPTPTRWITRADVIRLYPISRSTLEHIPQTVLPSGKVGKAVVYDIGDVEALFERLRGTSLKNLIEKARRDTVLPASVPEPQSRRRGRPAKPPVTSRTASAVADTL